MFILQVEMEGRTDEEEERQSDHKRKLKGVQLNESTDEKDLKKKRSSEHKLCVKERERDRVSERQRKGENEQDKPILAPHPPTSKQ